MMNSLETKNKIQNYLSKIPNKASYYILDNYSGDLYIVLSPHKSTNLCGIHILNTLSGLDFYPSSYCKFLESMQLRLDDGSFDITADIDSAVKFFVDYKGTNKLLQNQEIFINIDEI
jgi:hypothetical protein